LEQRKIQPAKGQSVFQPFELLEQAAASKPGDIGFISPADSYSFLQMHKISKAMAKSLSDSGVRSGQIVATFLPPEIDWLMTLAIFHEAAIPVSMWGIGSVKNLDVTWFVSQSPHPSVPPERNIIFDGSITERAVEEASDYPRTLYARADKPMRYVLTSGTTGEAKSVILTAEVMQNRLRNFGSYWTSSQRELNFMGLSTSGGFFTALACLANQIPYQAEKAVEPAALNRAIAQEIEVLAGSPAQIGQALKVIVQNKLAIPSIKQVRTAGSNPSKQLISAIQKHLGVEFRSVYGSTEGGGIAVSTLTETAELTEATELALAGELIQGVKLEIAKDEQSQSDENNPVGTIRYKGPGLSPGYSKQSDTEKSYKDGWFYPGDSGYLTTEGKLVVSHRIDDLLNTGGKKTNPELIESTALALAGVIDVGACVVEKEPGIEQIALAVVAEKQLDLRTLDQLLRKKHPLSHPTVFARVDEIPRNQMGKISRLELSQYILDQLKQS